MWWIAAGVVLFVTLGIWNAVRWKLPIPEEQVEFPHSSNATHGLLWTEAGYGVDRGRGFTLVRLKGFEPMDWHTLTVDVAGVRAVPVIGTERRPEAVGTAGFAVGREVVLKAEPDYEDDPEAIAVWDRAEEQMAGHLSPDYVDRAVVLGELRGVDPPRSFVVWETTGDRGARVGVRLLIVYRDAPICVLTSRSNLAVAP